MLLESQDKEHIINFDNVKEIRYSRPSNSLRVDIFEDYELTLGTYKTEERAKEILNEIIRLYEKCQIVVDDRRRTINYVQRPKVYRMPEE